MNKYFVRILFSGAVLVSAVGATRADFFAPPLSLSPIQTLDEAPAAVESGYGISGNWSGARDQLKEHHAYAGGFVRLDMGKVLRGGLDTQAWPLSYLLNVYVAADLKELAGLPGAMAYFEIQSHDQFTGGDAIVGDTQSYSNITAPRFVQVSQIWYKQKFEGVGTLKVGKIDANGDAALPDGETHTGFSLMEHNPDFLHSGAVYSPSMFTLPTYPTGAPGIEVFLGEPVYIGVGAFYNNNHQTFLNIAGHPESVQASAGGMFYIAEVGARWTLGALTGHAGAGGWYHSGNFPRNNAPGNNRGAGGGYLFADQTLFHDEAGGATREVGAFMLAGMSDKNTSPINQSVAFGVSALGFVPGRPNDSVGILASWAHLSPQPGLLHPFELAAEVYYRIQLTKWASLKPDFQYIVSPSGTLPDAAVVTLRAEISF